MIAPSEFLDTPTPIAFAHRGGAADGDENTADAFARAVSLGYRYIETDVQATADGVPVLFHDATLHRVAGRSGAIGDLRWADLATVRLGGETVVPRLDEVLASWRQVRFNLDIKDDQAAAPAVETIMHAGASQQVLLAAFSDDRIHDLRRLAGPSVATGVARAEVRRLWLGSHVGWAPHPPASAVAVQVPPHEGRFTVVTRRFVRLVHRLGLQVHVWTIDEARTMHELLDLGVDGIMTDRLDVLRDVYRSRGCWHEA